MNITEPNMKRTELIRKILNEDKYEGFDISQIPNDGLSKGFQEKMAWVQGNVDDVINAILYFTPGASVSISIPAIKKLYQMMGVSDANINKLIASSSEKFIKALPQILLYTKPNLEKVLAAWRFELKWKEDTYGEKNEFTGEFENYNMILDELKQLCPDYNYSVTSYYDEVWMNEINCKYIKNPEVYLRFHFNSLTEVDVTSGKYHKKWGYNMNDEWLTVNLNNGSLTKLVEYMKELGRLNKVPNLDGINGVDFDKL